MTFDGLTQELFDTYAPEKWSSMVYNLPRMKGKDTLLALCAGAAAEIEKLFEDMVRTGSDEIPNISNQKKVDEQWVYWFRNPEARERLSSLLRTIKLDQSSLLTVAAHQRHIIVGAVISQDRFFAGLRLPSSASVDWRNLSSKLKKGWEREVLLESLHALPESASIAVLSERVSAAEVTLEHLQGWSEQMSTQEGLCEIGVSLEPEVAIEMGADLVIQLRTWLQAIMPVYHFAAWSRENDHIEVTKQLQAEKAAKRQQASSYKKGDKVRVVQGLFKGKTGVIEGTDAKANVKVRVGKMSVNLSGHDVVPA